MYPRVVKVRGAQGTTYEYVRLVESYRENGRNKQRVVANLGRRDVLEPHLDALVRLLRGEDSEPSESDGQVQALEAWDWGPVRALRALWQQMDLDNILDRLDRSQGVDYRPLADRAFVLVANRLICPSSEHGLAGWLETDYVCDRRGRRWEPLWRDERQRRRSRCPRVRVQWRQLQSWYRTLDQLYARKSEIELELYRRLRDLFSLEIDVAFYDLTSTYFQGHGPEPLAAHGNSKDGKPRQRQVLLGVVLVQGWPLAHHVFRGNLRDSATLPGTLKDLQQRFAIRRVIVVGDRGMVTSDNVKQLRSAQQGYVLGLPRRRNKSATSYIERATGQWQDCPGSINDSEKSDPPRTRVQEVDSDEDGVRVFVVESQQRLTYEKTEREKSMKRVRERLEKLRQRVEKGRLKAAEKVGAAAARALARDHGTRYYDWKYEDGVFEYFEHPVHLKREKALEGKYLIQTEEEHLSAVEAVAIYKELSEVERAFRNLKDVLKLRPIYHQTESRVQAHIFIAALAFLLQRALEKRLKAAGVDLSPSQALQALRTIRIVDIDLGDGRKKRSVTRGTARCASILKALEISDLTPPSPCEQEAGAV